jgi:DNA-binding response OmpR family regulator
MFRVSVITGGGSKTTELCSRLSKSGFTCSTACDSSEVVEEVLERSPDLVLVDVDDYSRAQELSRMMKKERPLPVVALVSRERLDNVDGHLDIDDFVVKPCDSREIELRAKRLLRRANNADNNDLIKCGDLVIDLVKCEVSVGGKPIMLTFKEYELLTFLAGNKGRVFTREALLNRVWGYDYYGGDRTVDVHVRRLRSKIEDHTHTFIETVRNIGYRLRE